MAAAVPNSQTEAAEQASTAQQSLSSARARHLAKQGDAMLHYAGKRTATEAFLGMWMSIWARLTCNKRGRVLKLSTQVAPVRYVAWPDIKEPLHTPWLC
jgi:hypothetical protein